jgi:hypothetical protein
MGLPVYRPLAGDDKAEILRLARQIGTYRISCEPFEDCCPRFMPRAPAIFARPQELEQAEGRLDIDALVRLGLDAATCLDYKFEQGEVRVHEGPPRRLEKPLGAKKPMEAQPAPHDAASK